MPDLYRSRTRLFFRGLVGIPLLAAVIALPAVPVMAGRFDKKIQGASRCEAGKALAAGQFYRCLTKAVARLRIKGDDLERNDRYEDEVARCEENFDRAFTNAEADGECRTAGGPSTIRGPILMQVEAMAANIATGPGCPSGNLKVLDQTATCQVSTTASAIDLAAIVTQLQDENYDVDGDTTLWIQAWGASGAPGADGSNGGGGGQSGYAQTITTVNKFLEDFGTTEIYYYIGNQLSSQPGSGGPGGAATIVSTADLSKDTPSLYNTVLVAGGGGGGGGGRGPKTLVCLTYDDVLGSYGGEGGVAIAPTDAVAAAAGVRGGTRRNSSDQFSGYGGGGDLQGTGGDGYGGLAGGTGYACRGGLGGGIDGQTVGFTNVDPSQITKAGGYAAPGFDSAGGGGGGGGLGGGGGGDGGDDTTDCVSGGGGGGGSFATQSEESCSAAPASRPVPPNNGLGVGFVQIVFDLGACSGS